MARRHHKQDCDPFDFEQLMDDTQVALEMGLTFLEAIRAVRQGLARQSIDVRGRMPDMAYPANRRAALPELVPPMTVSAMVRPAPRGARRKTPKRRSR